MKNIRIDDTAFTITPSASSSPTDFDFLMGNHTVHHRKLKDRLTGSNDWLEFDGTHTMEPLLQGIGNLEQHRMTAADGNPVEGIALRLFDPQTRLWSIYWADSRSGKLGIPMIGSFDEGIGYFLAKEEFNGIPILVQFKWDASNPDLPVWSQAYSVDNGNAWEWNWVMNFVRA